MARVRSFLGGFFSFDWIRIRRRLRSDSQGATVLSRCLSSAGTGSTIRCFLIVGAIGGIWGLGWVRRTMSFGGFVITRGLSGSAFASLYSVLAGLRGWPATVAGWITRPDTLLYPPRVALRLVRHSSLRAFSSGCTS